MLNPIKGIILQKKMLLEIEDVQLHNLHERGSDHGWLCNVSCFLKLLAWGHHAWRPDTCMHHLLMFMQWPTTQVMQQQSVYSVTATLLCNIKKCKSTHPVVMLHICPRYKLTLGAKDAAQMSTQSGIRKRSASCIRRRSGFSAFTYCLQSEASIETANDESCQQVRSQT